MEAGDRLELAGAWSLIGVCLGEINTDIFKLKNWNRHPLGKGLAIKLLKTFEQQKDLQNLALLAALILGSETTIIGNLLDVKQSIEYYFLKGRADPMLIKSEIKLEESGSKRPLVPRRNQLSSQALPGPALQGYAFPRGNQDKQ